MLSITSCTTYANNEHCDPEKNYINSNPEAIEDYKELVKKGNVNSYYYKSLPVKSCEYNQCIFYNANKYDFQELYFDDNLRKGIYTIKITNDDKCFVKKYSSDKNCYSVTKNENDSIKSRFYLEYKVIENTNYVKFVDLEKNVILFESVFQRYHIPTIFDTPSGDTCKIQYFPENYIFNIFSFPK